MTTVHALLPPGVDDPARPSGGNRYDRRLCDGLAGLGWAVRERVVPGRWPVADPTALGALAATLAAVPDGGLVLLDGLIASSAATVLLPESGRLRLVALVHMPRPDGVPTAEAEAAALGAMRAVLTTSDWTRRRLIEDEGVPAARLHVARPGVDVAAPAAGRPGGRRLLAVGAVVPHKGHDLLLDALARILDLDWTCRVVGPLDSAPSFAGPLEARAAALGGRIRFTGPLHGAALARAYGSADVLVLPSRAEAFGLVVLEALAAGLPVIGFRTGGVPEALALGSGPLPGLLVPAEDGAALAEALRSWLGDAALRDRLRAAAASARAALPGWDDTVRAVAAVLRPVAE